MPTPPSLEYEFTMHASLDEPMTVGAGSYGLRVVAPVAGGWVRGPRLNGEIKGPGADWLLVGNDGYGHIDVRAQLVTDDGAVIYVYYEGLLELNEAALLASSSHDVESGWDDYYMRTAPRFESGAPQYSWLQQSTFVARGRMTLDGVEYDVFRVS